MKNRYTTTALLVALACTASVNAAIVSGSDGVNMGNTTSGRISNMKDLTPNVVGNWTGLSAWARVVAPVANFTGIGYDAGGAAFNVLYANLIPLKTSSLRTVDAAGNTVFLSDATGNHMDSLYLKDSSGGEKLIEVENGQLLVGGAPAGGGGSGSYSVIQTRYIGFQNAADGTLTLEGKMKFAGETLVENDPSNLMATNGTDDTIILQPGRTYKLTYDIGTFACGGRSETANIRFQFVNTSPGGTEFGPLGAASCGSPITLASSNGVVAYITPTAAAQVSLRCKGLSGASYYTVGDSGNGVYPSLTVETWN